MKFAQLIMSSAAVLCVSQAFASPQSQCREEALASGQQAIESLFEGNESLSKELEISSSKVQGGYQAIVIGESYDYHRGADVTPTFVTSVNLLFDEACAEVARTISKK